MSSLGMPGCWVKRNLGLNTSDNIVLQIAINLGWKPEDEGPITRSQDFCDLEGERYDDGYATFSALVDESEIFLGDKAPDGYWIGWKGLGPDNEEFGMWRNEEGD